MVGRPSNRSSSGRKALQEVREWSGGLPGVPAVVGKPSRRSGSGREALQEIRQVERHSRTSENGREALSKFREWSVGSP